MRTKPQRLCRKNRVTRIHEKRRIETCCRDARLSRSGSQRKEISQRQHHFPWASRFLLVLASPKRHRWGSSWRFCFSGATPPNPNATTRIVRQQLNRWVVNISALHVGPRKIFWRDFNQRGVTVLYVAWCAAAVKVQPPGAVSAACPWGGVTKGQTIRHDKLSVVR